MAKLFAYGTLKEKIFKKIYLCEALGTPETLLGL
jgi:hypothetical protein